jgi:hypothetical protein
MELDLTHYEGEILRLHRQLAHMTGLLRDAQQAIRDAVDDALEDVAEEADGHAE